LKFLFYFAYFQPEHFQKAIDTYIETGDPGDVGQFWPIVSKVTIRLPNCDACSSGAVLADLPGVRDSNAARDKIAGDVIYAQNKIRIVIFFCSHRTRAKIA
jgi:hypothetical protein